MKIAVVLLAAAILVVAGAFAGFEVLRATRVGLLLSDQPATLSIVQPLEVTAKVQTPLKITLDGIISAKVPLKQRLKLPLRGRYRTMLDLDTTVPLRFDVEYEGVLPVDTMAAIRASTTFNYNDAKYLRNLQFATSLPLKLNIPVKLHCPVDQQVRLVYRAPLGVEIDQMVEAPIDIVIPADIRVNKDFDTTVTSLARIRVAPPKDALKLVIDRADLSLALSTLRLERTTGGGERISASGAP